MIDPVIGISDAWVTLTRSEVVTHVVVVVAWFTAAFCLGAGWAAYRAVGWVERMRAWAHGVQVEVEQLVDADCIANSTPDGMGLE